MKIRNGFVSNSSSSSFILGYGIITDEDKFNKYCKNNNIDIDSYDIKIYDKWPTSDERILVGGNVTELLVPQNICWDGTSNYNKLLTIQILNDEGDGRFTYTIGENEELDYSIAKKINFYSEKQQKIINIINESFIKNGYIIYGAERNG